MLGGRKASQMAKFLIYICASVHIVILVIAKARSAPLMMVVSIEHGDKH